MKGNKKATSIEVGSVDYSITDPFESLCPRQWKSHKLLVMDEEKGVTEKNVLIIIAYKVNQISADRKSVV